MAIDGTGEATLAPETTFGGTVATVLASDRIAPPPGDARGGPQRPRPRREDRGADPSDRAARDQVRLLPAGLDHRPRDGQGRRVDVLPAGRRARLPARLRRHGQPVHRPPRQLHRLRSRGVRAGRDRRPRHVRRAAVGRARRARLLRLLRHRDRRAARRRPAPEPQADRRRVRAGARLPVPDRDRARDDVAQAPRRRRSCPRA